MTRTGTVHCGVCQSRFESSDCFERKGQGTTEDPFYYVPRLDDDEANLLECSRNGLAAVLPAIYGDPPAVHAYATVEQPIPFKTPQVLFFNEERYDTDNMHSRTDQSSRLTFNTSGIYRIVLNLRWDKFMQDITGDVAASIRRNGVETIAFESDAYGNTDLHNGMSVKAIAAFEPGEYVEATAEQDALDAADDETTYVNVLTTERWSPIFAAMFLRPLP
jgi:hypothetical protein